MRSTYLAILIILGSVLSSAKPMSFNKLLSESQLVRKTIASQKSMEHKKTELKKWQDVLQSTLKAYETEFPVEGNKEEEHVIKLFFSMEPVFELVNSDITAETCKKAEHQIELEDRDMTRKGPSVLSNGAKEAMAILKLFCIK